MSPQLQAALKQLGQDEVAELKKVLADLVDKEIPGLVAAEAADLGSYGPVISVVVQALYPKLQAIVDAKIAGLFPNA